MACPLLLIAAPSAMAVVEVVIILRYLELSRQRLQVMLVLL